MFSKAVSLGRQASDFRGRALLAFSSFKSLLMEQAFPSLSLAQTEVGRQILRSESTFVHLCTRQTNPGKVR